jgi:hypothetical protein
MSTLRLVIEPHADDAFISLGGHIDHWLSEGDAVFVITVFSDPKRNAETEGWLWKLADLHKEGQVRWQWAGAPEGGAADRAATKKGIAAARSGIKKWISEAYVAVGQGRLPPSRMGQLAVYFPLGVAHPEHIEVASWARDCGGERDNVRWFRYLDQPYSVKIKNGGEVQRKLEGKVIWSYMMPHARKWRHAKLFKSQSAFFHFELDACKRSAELIVGMHR